MHERSHREEPSLPFPLLPTVSSAGKNKNAQLVCQLIRHFPHSNLYLQSLIQVLLLCEIQKNALTLLHSVTGRQFSVWPPKMFLPPRGLPSCLSKGKIWGRREGSFPFLQIPPRVRGPLQSTVAFLDSAVRQCLCSLQPSAAVKLREIPGGCPRGSDPLPVPNRFAQCPPVSLLASALSLSTLKPFRACPFRHFNFPAFNL